MNESGLTQRNDGMADSPSQGQPVQKLAYGVKEAAQALGVCPATVYNLIARGLLKSCGALRHKVIPVTEIQRFLNDTLE